VRRFLCAVAVVSTVFAGLVGGAGPAGAATSITAPAGNPYVVPHDGAGLPQPFDISVAGFAAGVNVYVEQCDGVSSTAQSWDPTAHCDIVTSPAPVISSAGGAATFDKTDPNHGFQPFKGASPQGLFNCLAPNDPATSNGLVDYKNCQIRISTNNTAVTGDQVFLRLQLPEDPNTPPPTTVEVGMGNVRMLEGASGTRAMAFSVGLSEASATPITLDYKTLPGTATEGSDFVAKAGQLTIAAGATSAQIAVTINGDTVVEPNEKFTLKLQHPSSNAVIRRVGATATIMTDDPPKPGVRMAIGDAAVLEGNAATRSLRITASLSEASTQDVSATYETIAGNATEGSDYTAKTGTVTIAAGKTSAVIQIKVKGDTTTEGNEHFTVKLTNGVHANISRVKGDAIILNDD
jgi:Calx-beta domain